MEKTNVIVLGVAVELGSREVEGLLGVRHGIDQERRVAFRGRLEHLRRLGCPVGVQTGKGKRAVFGWKQITELAFALDLIDLGINPENAARVIIEHELALLSAVKVLLTLHDVDVLTAVRDRKWPFRKTMLIDVGVHALSGLKTDGTLSSTTLGPVPGWKVADWFLDQDASESRHVLVNLGASIANLANFASAWTGRDQSEVAAELVEWGDRLDVLHT